MKIYVRSLARSLAYALVFQSDNQCSNNWKHKSINIWLLSINCFIVIQIHTDMLILRIASLRDRDMGWEIRNYAESYKHTQKNTTQCHTTMLHTIAGNVWYSRRHLNDNPLTQIAKEFVIWMRTKCSFSTPLYHRLGKMFIFLFYMNVCKYNNI